jgi:hypothetical protein
MILDEALAEIDETALAPELRALGNPEGVPIKVGGETWLLAFGGIAAALDPYRDRMDDQARLTERVSMSDVFEAAQIMLLGNYELSLTETVGLLAEADPKELLEAVMEAMFGGQGVHRTYTQWMLSSLYGAGLDPEKIPPAMIPIVLSSLVRLNRAVPVSKFTDAAIAAPRIQAARARAEAHKVKAAELANAIPSVMAESEPVSEVPSPETEKETPL